jgi:hypothetical protein
VLVPTFAAHVVDDVLVDVAKQIGVGRRLLECAESSLDQAFTSPDVADRIARAIERIP